MTSGKWWSFYGTRGDQDGAVLWDVRCACCGEFVTRHDLAELPSKCPRCGEGAMTNYEKLFGTPERVAITFATIEEWLANEVRMSPAPEEGKEWLALGPYYLLSETVGDGFGYNAMALLEWLRGDA